MSPCLTCTCELVASSYSSRARTARETIAMPRAERLQLFLELWDACNMGRSSSSRGRSRWGITQKEQKNVFLQKSALFPAQTVRSPRRSRRRRSESRRPRSPRRHHRQPSLRQPQSLRYMSWDHVNEVNRRRAQQGLAPRSARELRHNARRPSQCAFGKVVGGGRDPWAKVNYPRQPTTR